MFEVSVEHTFAAGHALRNYKGKCENVHGHNYRVQVLVRGEKLQEALKQENPVEVAEVKVWETDIQSATYRPPSTLASR